MEKEIHKEVVIAILSFQIFSDEEKLSPLISGFTEDLTYNFSKFVGISVISHFSTRNLNYNSNDLEKLNADYIISGSFRNSANNIRINVQLIRSEDQMIVYTRQYEDTLSSILETQDEIIHEIVNVIQEQIDYDILSFSYKKDPVQLVVHENWLLGMDYIRKGSLENDEIARKYFEAALKIDPHYARAYSGISLSYFNEWSCQLWDRWEVSQKGAHKYALKALEYDENDYISLAILGRTFLYLEEFEKSEHYVRKSIRMNPNDSRNLIHVAFTLVYLGYAKEAETLYKRALAINPLHNDTYLVYGSFIYLELGEFEKSIQLGNKVKMESAWIDFPVFLATAYFHLSEFDKAKELWNQFLLQFQKNINKGKETNNQEALNWHINVNPYKGKTYLKKFWDFIGEEENSFVESQNLEKTPKDGAFLKSGEIWEITYMGLSISMKDSKGLSDISKLLENPQKEFHCIDLIDSAIVESTSESVFDTKAKASYQQKILKLKAAIEDAEEMNNTEKAARLYDEYDKLVHHLSGSLGLSDKPRKTDSVAEKARSAVTWRIRNAIKKIGDAHPSLGKHLAKSIKTGTFCVYNPEYHIDWII